jgi:hypothetical protein
MVGDFPEASATEIEFMQERLNAPLAYRAEYIDGEGRPVVEGHGTRTGALRNSQ